MSIIAYRVCVVVGSPLQFSVLMPKLEKLINPMP